MALNSNGTSQYVLHAEDVKLLDKRENNIKKTQKLSSRLASWFVYRYMLGKLTVSCQQIARQNHNINNYSK